MNKKELSEIKKIYSPKNVATNCSISRVTGCYVNGEHEIKARFSKSWHSLPETDTFKYIEILKKVLSGTEGKNALTLDISGATDQKRSLLALRNSNLSNDAYLDAFYQSVIENFEYVGNYLILLFDDSYDIPIKAKDSNTGEIESEEVYHYMLCAICPVSLEKAGLIFDETTGEFRALEQRHILELPVAGFLYPSFDQRSANEDGIMYYLKKAEENYPGIIENVFGVVPDLTAKQQKEAFQMVIEETFGDEKEFEVFNHLQDYMDKMTIRNDTSPDAKPLELTKKNLQDLLVQSGAKTDVIEQFDKAYDVHIKDHKLLMKNIHSTKNYEVKTPAVVVKVASDSSNLVSTKVVDGQKCLVIQMQDNVQIDGIDVVI